MAEEKPQGRESEAQQARRVKNPFLKRLSSFDDHRPDEENMEETLWGGRNAPGGPRDQQPKR